MGGAVFAGGTKEDKMPLAKSLVQEKRYNEAIIILTEIVKKDPERLDEVESLLKVIREVRSEYNQRYENLIDVLYEKHDVEQALKIIAELESLDKSPDKATLQAVAQAKSSAAFVYNLNRFTKIMDEGLVLINRKDYWNAVSTYLEGFGLHKEDFDTAGYGNIVTTQVNKAVADVQAAARAFIESRAVAIQKSGAVTGLSFEGNFEGIAAVYNAFIDQYKMLASARKTLYNAADMFLRQNTFIQKAREGVKEDFFLSYIYRLINGRTASSGKEGMLAAMDLYWNEEVKKAEEKLFDASERQFQKAVADYQGERWENAAAGFRMAYDLARLFETMMKLWQTRLYTEPDYSFAGDGMALLKEKLPRFLAQQAQAYAANAYIGLINIQKDVKVAIEIPDTEPGLISARNEIVQKMQSAERMIQEIAEYEAYNKKFSSIGYSLERAMFTTARLGEFVRTSVASIRQEEIAVVGRLAYTLYDPIRTAFLAQKALVDQGKAYVHGIEEAASAEGNLPAQTVLYRYPERGIETFKTAQTALKAIYESNAEFLRRFEGEKDYVRTNSAVASVLSASRNLQQEMTTLQNSIATLSKDAENQIFLAERYKNEGFLRTKEAEAALARNAFDQARLRIADARQSFSVSLSYREDQKLRRETDASLLKLSQSITDAENSIVVRDVRAYITEGKRLYQQGQFDSAENVLLRAQNRWLTTNTVENDEVSYWLRFVRAALSVQSGRTIGERDPLFREMSQLLNLAKEDYLAGKRLLEKNQKRDALEAFNKAEEKILRIRIPFPFNQEASVLTLKILQLKDKDNFTQIFQQKLKDAQVKVASNPQEGYIELKDLEQINATYPGLQKAIYDVELKLGIRVPPPDPAALNQSEAFYREALKIVNTNNRVQYPIALEQLNRAIALNPENQKAIELKDRISIDTGGQSSVVLSSRAEEQYRAAEEKYVQGNFFEALAIVERLLLDKNNQKYPPLLDLKRRIESKI